jgi:hypothetical protein
MSKQNETSPKKYQRMKGVMQPSFSGRRIQEAFGALVEDVGIPGGLAMAEGFGSTLASRLWPPKREVPPPD